MRFQKPAKVIIISLLFLACILSPQSFAEIGVNSAVERIMNTFHDNAASWENSLRNYALNLFWLLAGIEFTWSAIRLALKGVDLSEFLAELLNRVLYLGFFLTLLLHSSEWAAAIVQSFRAAADNAGSGHGISPEIVLGAGLEISTKLFHSLSLFRPGEMVVVSLCGISILLCFGLMAANLIEALIESYIVISAGVIMMGFGGSSWTNEYAKKILIYALSVGVKLFLIQLLMGLAETLIDQFTTEFDGNNIEDALVMVGIALIMWIITLNIPNKLQALINGTSFGQGGMIAGAITAGMTAAASIGAAAATGGTSTLAGATSSVIGASKLATQQMQNSATPPTFANRLRQMAQNTKEAGMSTLGQRFRGEVRHGNFGGQMGHTMSQQAEALKTQREAKEKAAKEKNTIRPE